jgi:hypothetical protein
MFRKISLLFSLGFVFLLAGPAFSYVASSPSYQLEKDSINFGGGLSNSASYSQESTAGEAGTGLSNSASYSASAGYQTPDEVPPVVAPPGGGGSNPVPGCTDSLAINYSASATSNDGSCIYATTIPNATNFSATYQSGPNNVLLTWSNPSFVGFQAVRIVRGENSVVSNPTGGTLIYDGSAQSITDSNIQPDKTYYYTLFVRATTGDYSSGVVAFVVTPSLEQGEEIFPPPPPDDGDPFENFPTVLDPNLAGLKLADFIFVQPGDKEQGFFLGSIIDLSANKPTTIYLPYDRVPVALKAIGVVVVDPDDPNKKFSFLLRANADKTAYTATIAPLAKGGRYPVYIYVINYKDQTIKRISGVVDVAGPRLLTAINVAGFVNKTLLPLAVSISLLTGVAGATGALAKAQSLTDIYLMVVRAFGSILGFFGLKKKNKPWGTVYDSVTKRPIDPAYISVFNQSTPDKEIASAITDIDGRYGLFLPQGAYTMTAGKTHYQFPSTVLRGKKEDELYDNLYFGDPFVTSGGEVINLNIPIDPIGFDWNEFAKSQTAYFKVFSDKELKMARVTKWVTWLGFLATAVSLLLSPSYLNIVLFISYLVLFAFQMWWKEYHKIVGVRRGDTGEVIPFAIVRAFYADINQEVKHVVTDALGRFYILVRPGKYYFTIDHRQPDGAYARVFQSQSMDLKKGVLSSDIVI